MQQPSTILVFIYNSYKDPLFQNLLLSYIKTLSKQGAYRFELITFEQDEYRLTQQEQLREKKDLASNWNIHWHPQQFHTGRFLLLKKLIDLIQALFILVKIKFLHQPQYIFAFANVAASFSFLVSHLLRMKLVIYSYEPHSEFMAELGVWNRSSFKYKTLSFLERQAGIHASHVMTGTKYGVELLHSMDSKANIYRAPTAVDENEFYFKEEGRKTIRENYSIEDKFVVLYMGKFGDLYYKEEVASLCSGIAEIVPNSHFIIVTRYDHDTIRKWFNQHDLSNEQLTLTKNLSDDEVKDYLSAADLGISAVPPSPVQKFRSPTKVAEYLLCGLPYITCIGVSEDDLVADNNEVGIVVNQFSKVEIIEQRPVLEKMMRTDKIDMVKKCRAVGINYRSKAHIDNLLLAIFG